MRNSATPWIRFMMVGEPHIDVRRVGEDELQVAAWFLDTDDNGNGHIVSHAYFTRACDPHDKLRRAMRADISDEAWATANSTISRPHKGRGVIEVNSRPATRP